MTKKRSIILTVGLVAILTVFLEVLSGYIINYNIITRIISSFLYFSMLCFTVIDTINYITSKTYKVYHAFSMCRDVSILLAIIVVFHFLGNLQKIEISFIILHLILVVVFAILAKISGNNETMNKISHNKEAELLPCFLFFLVI